MNIYGKRRVGSVAAIQLQPSAPKSKFDLLGRLRIHLYVMIYLPLSPNHNRLLVACFLFAALGFAMALASGNLAILVLNGLLAYLQAYIIYWRMCHFQEVSIELACKYKELKEGTDNAIKVVTASERKVFEKIEAAESRIKEVIEIIDEENNNKETRR